MLGVKTMRCAAFVVAVLPGAAQAGSPWAGIWNLQAAYDLKADGGHGAPYGQAPQGRMMVDDDGRYMIEIYGDTPLPFTAGVKARGTADEFRAAVMGSSVHYGRIETDTATCTLVFHIERAAYPNWNGIAQTRRYSYDDSVLSYSQPPAVDGSAPVTVWKRLTGGSAPSPRSGCLPSRDH